MSNEAEGWFLDQDEPSEIIDDMFTYYGGWKVFVDRELAEKELEKDTEGHLELYKITIERITPK